MADINRERARVRAERIRRNPALAFELTQWSPRDRAFRDDPCLFATRLGFAPDDWQRTMLTTSRQNMVVVASRQSGKSRTASILALHRAVFFPGSLVLVISKSMRQSGLLFHNVSTMLRELKRIMDAPPQLVVDNRLSMGLKNASRVVSLPASPDTLRGFSAVNLLIEDEAAFVSDQLFWAVSPMLATTRGRFVLMSTPHGKRGHFYDAWHSGGDIWERITVKAERIKRISPEFLAQQRQILSPWMYAQEYECEFTDNAMGVFMEEDVQAMYADDIEPLFEPGTELSLPAMSPATHRKPTKVRNLLDVASELWTPEEEERELSNLVLPPMQTEATASSW